MSNLRDFAANDVDFIFADLAEEISYTASGSEAVTIDAIVTNYRTETNSQAEGDVTFGDCDLRVKSSDIAEPTVDVDFSVINSKRFIVREIQRGAGSWLLHCTFAQESARRRPEARRTK